jgi:hypothetical protein
MYREHAHVAGFLLLFFLYVIGGEPAQGQELSRGQTVYVSVYSSIWHGTPYASDKPNTISLSGMLSIRNVDTSHNITVRSVRYYDTDGNLMREEKPPLILRPLATKSIFVPHSDTGGIGANFIVEWEAQTLSNIPIIDYLNIYQTGVSMSTFVSHGQAIKNQAQP